MNADSNQQFLIGRLAKLAGVKSDTIRFYERCGLLPKPERKASGYRVYDEAALKLVRFIKRAQALGFSLDEIRRILSLRGGGKKTCDHVLAIAEATLEETERRLAELQAFRDVLKRFFRGICVDVRPGCGVPSPLLATVKRTGGIKLGLFAA